MKTEPMLHLCTSDISCKLRGKAVPARVVDTPVSLIDLGPTFLDVFGLDTPGEFMGQSLVPILAGGEREFQRPIAAEGRLRRAMVFSDGYKIIWDTRARVFEAYDLGKDPLEKNNLFDADDPIAARHYEELRAFFQAHTVEGDGYQIPFRG